MLLSLGKRVFQVLEALVGRHPVDDRIQPDRYVQDDDIPILGADDDDIPVLGADNDIPVLGEDDDDIPVLGTDNDEVPVLGDERLPEVDPDDHTSEHASALDDVIPWRTAAQMAWERLNQVQFDDLFEPLLMQAEVTYRTANEYYNKNRYAKSQVEYKDLLEQVQVLTALPRLRANAQSLREDADEAYALARKAGAEKLATFNIRNGLVRYNDAIQAFEQMFFENACQAWRQARELFMRARAESVDAPPPARLATVHWMRAEASRIRAIEESADSQAKVEWDVTEKLSRQASDAFDIGRFDQAKNGWSQARRRYDYLADKVGFTRAVAKTCDLKQLRRYGGAKCQLLGSVLKKAKDAADEQDFGLAAMAYRRARGALPMVVQEFVKRRRKHVDSTVKVAKKKQAKREELKKKYKQLLKYAWIEMRLRMEGMDALLADYGDEPETTDLANMRDALVQARSIVESDPTQLWTQLHGRLLYLHTSAIARAFKDTPQQPLFRMSTATLIQANTHRPVRPMNGHGVPIESAVPKINLNDSNNATGIRLPDDAAASSDGSAATTDPVARSKGDTTAAFIDSVSKHHSPMVSGDVQLDDPTIDDESRSMSETSIAVNGLVVSDDGMIVVSGSDDQTVKVWDVASHEVNISMSWHRDPVRSVAVSRDARSVISGGDDHLVCVWNAGTGQVEQSLEGHTEPVNHVCVTPDGNRIVSASEDGTIRVWRLKDRQRPEFEEIGAGTITEKNNLDVSTSTGVLFALSPDMRHVLSSTDEPTLKLWNRQTNEVVREFEGHTGHIKAVKISADGETAISASADMTIRVWDMHQGTCRHVLSGHQGGVLSLDLSIDGRLLISGGEDHTIKIWDLAGGHVIHTLRGHKDWVGGVAMTADQTKAISASSDGTLRLWDIKTGKLIRSLIGHSAAVRDVKVLPGNERAISASSDQSLIIWDLETARPIHILEGHTGNVWSVDITSDGRQAVSASYDRTLRIWDLQTGETVRTLEGHDLPVLNVCISMDGSFVMSSSIDQLLVWRLDKLRDPPPVLEVHEGAVWSVAVSPNNRRLVSASSDGTVKYWELATGQTISTLVGHEGRVLDVIMTADGCHALSCSTDRTIRIWDLRSGKPVKTLQGHSDAVTCIALSRSGRYLLSGSNDHSLVAWDLATGQPIARVTFDAPVNACRFIGKSLSISVGDESGQVHFIDLVLPNAKSAN